MVKKFTCYDDSPFFYFRVVLNNQILNVYVLEMFTYVSFDLIGSS